MQKSGRCPTHSGFSHTSRYWYEYQVRYQYQYLGTVDYRLQTYLGTLDLCGSELWPHASVGVDRRSAIVISSSPQASN